MTLLVREPAGSVNKMKNSEQIKGNSEKQP